MKIAKSWSLGTTVVALTLAAVPLQSSAAEPQMQGAPAAAVANLSVTTTAEAPAPVAQFLVPQVAAPEVPAAPALAEPESLDPGEYDWRPELARSGPVEMVVSIPMQRAFIYRGGTLIGVTTVSTGRAGHTTPTGRFPILEKRREHYSNLYNNAPMPFMQRLTWDGIALHAGQIPGRPASHGCVRLPMAMARHLFEATAVGGVVHITGETVEAQTALRDIRGVQLASLEAAGSVVAGVR